jgi:hypothetical protein
MGNTDRSLASLATFIIALAGSNFFKAWLPLGAFLSTEQLRTSLAFTIALWLWLPTALFAVWCGVYGGYLMFRNQSPFNWYVTAFAVLCCPVVEVSGYELSFATFRLSYTAGVDLIKGGVNLLGIALVVWVLAIRRRYRRPLQPDVPSGMPQGGGTT